MTNTAKQHFEAELGRLRETFASLGRPETVLRERSSLVDLSVVSTFAETLASVSPGGLALLAVGGYGRRELFPYSDIDLLLLTRRGIEEAEQKAALSEFLKRLWDAGLRLGHSVRTVEECCAFIDGNLELTVSLLDERLLAGDPVLYSSFRERFSKFLGAERNELGRRIAKMARARHAKFHYTIYRLEPDIKEHPGGLRDVHTLNWLMKVSGGEAPRNGVAAAAEFLHQVRCFLHFRAGRDSNAFSFEAQDELAEAAFATWKDPADWMRTFYRHARTASRSLMHEMEAQEARERSLLANFRDWRSRLSNSDFTVARDRVYLRNVSALPQSPALALGAFEFHARHGIPLAGETEMRLESALPGLRPKLAQAESPFAWLRRFVDLPHAPAAMRPLQDTGYLAALIPAWAHVEHLVVRDFYHQYTVDEHTFVTLDVLAGLRSETTDAVRRFASLLEESAEDAWMLRFALLFHDIGKGTGGEHSAKSVRVAEETLQAWGCPDAARATILFLIQHHLDLSSILQARDLGDPATARDAATRVHTIERLRLLTLLTYADISAVNPTAMNPWRMEQLWRLYRVTSRELTRALGEERIGSEAQQAFGQVSPEMSRFLEGLPTRYLWTHTPGDATAHFELFRTAQAKDVALDISRREGVFQLTFVASDRPFLFASIAGALASFGLNILKAEAFANQQHWVLDSFVFSDPTRNLELNPSELDRLRLLLRRVILGEVRAEDLLKHRAARPAPARRAMVATSVSCDPEAASTLTAIEVVTQDRPGLLYSLASAISRAGCNIEVVLVDTEAHKAIDVFHVTKSGKKLEPAAEKALCQAMREACQS
jgi:[protein-PII] uridylyltransferase